MRKYIFFALALALSTYGFGQEQDKAPRQKSNPEDFPAEEMRKEAKEPSMESMLESSPQTLDFLSFAYIDAPKTDREIKTPPAQIGHTRAGRIAVSAYVNAEGKVSTVSGYNRLNTLYDNNLISQVKTATKEMEFSALDSLAIEAGGVEVITLIFDFDTKENLNIKSAEREKLTLEQEALAAIDQELKFLSDLAQNEEGDGTGTVNKLAQYEAGETQVFELRGAATERVVKFYPKKEQTTANGAVGVTIYITPKGDVEKVLTNYKLTNTKNEDLLLLARTLARELKFEPDTTTKKSMTGEAIFVFKVQ